MKDLKVALVYDKVNKFGGAERVLLTLHEMFPQALLYTSVYNKKNTTWAKVFSKIYTSFLQNIPFAKQNNEWFAWLMPLAFESFNFNSYDLVISITSESAKGIITGTNTLHICYCLTPARYLWSGYEEYFRGSTFKVLSKPIVNYLRWWDKIASQRPDKIIAISTEVQKRIKKYYGLNSEIIFPPASTTLKALRAGSPVSIKNYYLYVGRLVKYKKIDILIKTFNELKLPLVIVGTGSEEKRLKSLTCDNVNFLGFVSDSELKSIYQNAKAFLMMQNEDFGITAVEAQNFGVPIIAYKRGGALDTVIENKTGIFFKEQTKESLKQAIAKFDTITFNDIYIKENAKKFSKERFKRQFQRSLIRTFNSWRGRNTSLASI